MIMLDREQIKQVFLNLFLNSLQAMQKGGTLEIKTWLKIGAGEGAENFIYIRVRDTGMGLNAKSPSPLEIIGSRDDGFLIGP